MLLMNINGHFPFELSSFAGIDYLDPVKLRDELFKDFEILLHHREAALVEISPPLLFLNLLAKLFSQGHRWFLLIRIRPF